MCPPNTSGRSRPSSERLIQRGVVLTLTMALGLLSSYSSRAGASERAPELGPSSAVSATTEESTGESIAEAGDAHQEVVTVRATPGEGPGDPVTARRADEGVVSARELELRASSRAGTLAEVVPGLMATQHSGGGKANQYFIRGFNLDHGTDFSLSVDGVPVNLPSHGHGQGYADLGFLIPELVAQARYQKGPYDLQVGDFSSAGSLELELIDSLPSQQPSLSLGLGAFDYGRVLFMNSRRIGEGNLLYALEGFHDDGPWSRGDDHDGGRAAVRYSQRGNGRGLSLTAMGYDATWLSSDQIPRRALRTGLVGRFDQLDHQRGPRGDTGPRGASQRFSVSLGAFRTTGTRVDRLNAYAVQSRFALISDFTYFLERPEDGDQFLQRDDRAVLGLALSRTWHHQIGDHDLGRQRLQTTVGADTRFDTISNALEQTVELVVDTTVRRDHIRQLGGGLFAQTSWQATNWLTLTGGLRIDGFHADVASDRARNSGRRSDAQLSPKLRLELRPSEHTQVTLKMGRGMHSNDARGAVLSVDPVTGDPARPADPLVASTAFDLTFQTRLGRHVELSFALFELGLDSELVFVGDAGTTEDLGPSRRRGIEVATRLRLAEHLSLEIDGTLTDAELEATETAAGESEIPGAVGRTLGAALQYRGSNWQGSLQLRHFSDVPLTEDGSEIWDGATTVDGLLSLPLPFAKRSLTMAVEVFNLLDSQESDVQYFYASRLPGEPAAGIEDVHLKPLRPRSARITLRWRP